LCAAIVGEAAKNFVVLAVGQLIVNSTAQRLMIAVVLRRVRAQAVRKTTAAFCLPVGGKAF
jgi:hypothetical protein